MSGSALFIAVFLACLVEAVEALTIILAAGTVRDWRSAMTGLGTALLSLAVIVAILGPAVSVIPLSGLRLFVGGLLLIFGLQWLRKAILRASGNKALHDEAAACEATLIAARGGRPRHRAHLRRGGHHACRARCRRRRGPSTADLLHALIDGLEKQAWPIKAENMKI